ncbi:hypothetical protein BGZ73_002474 [Actinomortierella ambigua]|nr:hypothetical protein BGZ73_002474 [Actinomortierella ambigua]
MFKFLWTRASAPAAQATADATSSSDISADAGSMRATHPFVQDDWVLLPTDYDDMMSQSISNLDLISASTMLPRSRNKSATGSAAAAASSSSSSTTDPNTIAAVPTKSRRQLKREMRQRKAEEQAERTPRYDPHMARLRDAEFKMAKMTRLSLRSGRVMGSSHSAGGGGGGTGRSSLTGAFAQQKAC